jgi:protein-tyrosine phosphatase
MSIHQTVLQRLVGRNTPIALPTQSVLFVCTANICRSPMAQRVFLKMAASEGFLIKMDSAGTHGYRDRMPPFPMAVATAKRRGYNLTRMVARQVRAGDFARFDLVLAMDRSNLADLFAISPRECRAKIHLLLDFSTKYHGRDVEDPYGGGVKDFERALDMIEDASRGYVRQLQRASPAAERRRRTHQ